MEQNEILQKLKIPSETYRAASAIIYNIANEHHANPANYIEPLMVALKNEDHRDTVFHILKALGESAHAAKEREAEVADIAASYLSETGYGLVALQTLGLLADQRAAEPAYNLLLNSAEKIEARGIGAKVLAQVNDPRAFELFKKILSEPDETGEWIDPETPRASLHAKVDGALRFLPYSPAMEELILKWLQSSSPRERVQGVEYAAHYKLQTAIPIMEKMLGSNAYENRGIHLGGKPFLDIIKASIREIQGEQGCWPF